jgi:hypothetical protein
MTLLGFCKKVQFISTCQLLNASFFTYYVKYRLVLYDSSDCSSTVWVKAHLKLFIHNFMAKQCSVVSFNLYCRRYWKYFRIIVIWCNWTISVQICLQYDFCGLLHNVFFGVELKSKMAATTGHSFSIGSYMWKWTKSGSIRSFVYFGSTLP